jgi:hypothetical protein
MLTQQLPRLGVFFVVSTFAGLVHAQEIPPPLAGPDGAAEYAYLSLAIPLKGQTETTYELRYDVCNRRLGNMSFKWEDVGFGTDLREPVTAGLCATYELDNQAGFRSKGTTTLRFSNGVQSPPAYLACETKQDCKTDFVSGVRNYVAKPTSYITNPSANELKKPTYNNILPLRVVVRTSETRPGVTRFDVDWAGKGVTFLTLFPNGKLGVDDLKQMATIMKGGTFDFLTLPSLEKALGLIVPNAPVAISVTPGRSAEVGNWILEVSSKAPIGQKVTVIIVDSTDRRIASLDVPLPASGQR